MKVLSGVPIPEKQNGDHVKAIKTMDVGQCLVVETEESMSINTAASYARVYARRSGKKFTQRQLDGEIRIWRTA